MTALTVGTFDMFHSGHVTLLKHCRSLVGAEGGVIVGVNTDRFVATFKPAPVQSLAERLAVVAACRYVDVLLENDAQSLEPVLLSSKATYLVVGADWAPPRDYMAQIGTTAEWLTAHGITLVFVPRPAGTQSSTKLKAAVRANG